MKYPHSLLSLLALAGLITACGTAKAATAEPTAMPGCTETPTVTATPPDDPNADPFGEGPWVINEDKTIWVSPMQWTSGPDGNKVMFIRPAGTNIDVTGQRVDGAEGALEVSAPRGYLTGFEVMGIAFPSSGCWQVSATAGKSHLDFVVDIP